MKVAFVGASGYGNVGDDTYPLVFAQQMPGHELLFYNSDLPASLPDDLGLLVLGGGGLLYNNPQDGTEDAESPHFRCMKFYMEAAMKRGIPWGILSCGFQFRPRQEQAYATSLAPWRPYLEKAAFITVRSPNCQRIANEMGRRNDAQFFPDAAYLLDAGKPGDGATEGEAAGAGGVMIVPAGAVNPRCHLMQHYMRQLAASGLPITWMSMGAPVDDNMNLVDAARLFPNTAVIARPSPQEARRRIALARLVITGRFHGMVFAKAGGVPFLTALLSPYKIMQEDHTTPGAAASGHFEVLRAAIRSAGGG